MKPATIVAFDFGTKSIGIASTLFGAEQHAPACTEIGTISAREGIPNWDDVGALLKEWSPKTVVVGLPLDADGCDMEITRRARKFGNRIRGMFGVKVEFIDETLSTKAAKSEALARGQRASYCKSPVDAIAARIILETWLQQNTAAKQGEPN